MTIAIGIDVAKENLAIYQNDTYVEIVNEASAIKAYFRQLSRKANILMEATGKYHRLAHKVLDEMGFSVMVINPYQSKHFAKALNLLCKTDKVDAKMLALFAERMDFKATPCASEGQTHLKDLSRHLDDLKQVKVSLEARARDSKGFVKSSLNKAIKTIEKEIEATEKALLAGIKADKAVYQNYKLLLGVPGIGSSTAVYLLSCLSELGMATRGQISALSGVAPMNNDSGSYSGRRYVRGGRRDIRHHLYMPVLGAATQHNERLKQFYQRLVAAGKPKKVALIACIRKLIVWCNAMLQNQQPWDSKMTCPS